MKKIANTLDAWMPPVRLYREDVEAIMDRVGRTTEKVTIASGDYTFDSLDELRERRGNLVRQLEVSGGFGSISLTIAQGGSGIRPRVALYGHPRDDDSAVAGEWRYLRDLLHTRVPWYGRLLRPGVSLFALLGSLFLLQVLSARVPVSSMMLLIPGTAGVILLLSAVYYWRGSTIYLDPRHKVPSFWKRNADQIGVGAIGAVIGSVLTLLVQAILAHFGKAAP